MFTPRGQFSGQAEGLRSGEEKSGLLRDFSQWKGALTLGLTYWQPLIRKFNLKISKRK